jgi:hypothetical protein
MKTSCTGPLCCSANRTTFRGSSGTASNTPARKGFSQAHHDFEALDHCLTATASTEDESATITATDSIIRMAHTENMSFPSVSTTFYEINTSHWLLSPAILSQHEEQRELECLQ